MLPEKTWMKTWASRLLSQNTAVHWHTYNSHFRLSSPQCNDLDMVASQSIYSKQKASICRCYSPCKNMLATFWQKSARHTNEVLWKCIRKHDRFVKNKEWKDTKFPHARQPYRLLRDVTLWWMIPRNEASIVYHSHKWAHMILAENHILFKRRIYRPEKRKHEKHQVCLVKPYELTMPKNSFSRLHHLQSPCEAEEISMLFQTYRWSWFNGQQSSQWTTIDLCRVNA